MPNVVDEQMPWMVWALIHRKCGEVACGLKLAAKQVLVKLLHSIEMAKPSLSRCEYLHSAGLRERLAKAIGLVDPSSNRCDDTAPTP